MLSRAIARITIHMKQFIWSLPQNIIGCFKGRMILWHVVAIVLTVFLVTSGFDWFYFCSTRSPVLREWAFPAVRIGGSLPITLPLVLLLMGISAQNRWFTRVGAAIAQAAIIGSLISSTYKAFTGRVHPMRHVGMDISRDFRFGFLRGGVFWGWPSSHTTIAFAMAVTLFTLLPKQRWAGWVAIAYAFYVGISVSITIHWFSDFVAGAIIGTVIGVVVGRCFLPEPELPDSPGVRTGPGESKR